MKKFANLVVTFFILFSAKSQNCPGIAVYPYSDEITAGDTLIFTCVTKNLTANVTYNWAISAGAIVSGQGTARIYVDTKDASGMFITATVELGGIPASCERAASASSEVIPGAQLAVKGTFTNGEELKKAVQKFIAATAFKDSANTASAFIYLYKAPNTTATAMSAFRQAIISAFEYNKILPYQYKIAEGGAKKLATYEMYLLMPMAKEPRPSE